MKSAAVEIQGLTRRFPQQLVPALGEVSVQFEEGKISGVVGPDGAGKTTLLRTLAGLLKPDQGSCKVFGYDTVKEAEEVRALIGYMPQRFGLYEELSVMQNLRLYADLHGVEPRKRGSLFSKLLDFAGLASFGTRLARSLSGGMKQKLGLICTLIGNPRVLFLDEPMVGIDPRSQHDLWDMIRDLNQRGVTVIWSTSNLSRAAQFDYTLLLNGGKAIFKGKPHQLTRRVEGRVFHVSGLGEVKREVLRRLVQAPSVVDVTLEGEQLRLVLQEGTQAASLADLGEEHATSLTPTTARFEDAFIDLLGGLQEHIDLAYAMEDQGRSSKHSPIEARNLTKRFGSFTAVNDVSFSLKRGEIFGLLGPNGAGKSTTFKMLCGLQKATEGQPLVEGRSLVTAPSDTRALIGYMAQSFSLYPNLTVMQNLRFFGGAYGVSNLSQRIEELLTVFGLHPFVEDLPANLSLGFKQRLALCCALIHRPPVLFLDEPTGGVDPLTRREFWHHINTLTQQGATVLVSTHLMDEAEFCDRIGFIVEGRLRVVDTPDLLRRRAVTAERPHPTLEDAFLFLCGDMGKREV